MFRKNKTPEYLEKKNVAILLMYNVLFLAIGIFALLSPTYRTKTFDIIYGSVCGGILAILFIVAIIYKDNTTIHFKRKFDNINKGLTYTYLASFLIYLILHFLVKNNKMSNIYIADIVIRGFSSLMILVSIVSIIVNSIVITKYEIKIPLSLFLEDLKNKKNNNRWN